MRSFWNQKIDKARYLIILLYVLKCLSILLSKISVEFNLNDTLEMVWASKLWTICFGLKCVFVFLELDTWRQCLLKTFKNVFIHSSLILYIAVNIWLDSVFESYWVSNRDLNAMREMSKTNKQTSKTIKLLSYFLLPQDLHFFWSRNHGLSLGT